MQSMAWADEDSLSNLSLSEIEDMVEGDEEEDGENKKNKKEEQVNNIWMEELSWKQNHPERLHDEMWFNLPGEVSSKFCWNLLPANLNSGLL